MEQKAPTTLHLRGGFGQTVCIKCGYDTKDEGAYTFDEEVHQKPPPGNTSCKRNWVE